MKYFFCAANTLSFFIVEFYHFIWFFLRKWWIWYLFVYLGQLLISSYLLDWYDLDFFVCTIAQNEVTISLVLVLNFAWICVFLFVSLSFVILIWLILSHTVFPWLLFTLDLRMEHLLLSNLTLKCLWKLLLVHDTMGFFQWFLCGILL